MAVKLDIRLKYNFKFNKQLIQLVEPHSLLHGFSQMQQNQTKIWADIAETLGVSFKYVQAHWKWLRERYRRFAKQGKSDGPYKIESYMHFLKPHLIVRNRRHPPPKKQKDESQPKLCLPPVPKIARVESFAHLGYDPADQDAVFLLSFAAHMKVMTGMQRRQFKTGAVTLSADILDR